jgi:aminoglycoside phosphotransferase (APT) family kinase protein
MTDLLNTLKPILAQYGLENSLSATPLGHGNINDTYRIERSSGPHYVLQRLNTQVFRDHAAVAHNHRLVARHLQSRNYPLLIPAYLHTSNGADYAPDHLGQHWRLMAFLPHTTEVEKAQSPHQARQAAKAVGTFLACLADLDASEVRDVLPGFHDSVTRFEQFKLVVEKDPVGRLKEVAAEVAYLVREAEIFSLIQRLGLPLRVVHNDPKIGNVLFDETGEKALALIDWDTIQAGHIPGDFGDLVRTMTPTFSEDHPDIAAIKVDRTLFQAAAEGFVGPLRGVIEPFEIENLFNGARWIVLEQMMRFLGDYLAGDTYYKIRYPAHNLLRAKNQLALYQSLREHEVELNAIIQSMLS